LLEKQVKESNTYSECFGTAIDPSRVVSIIV